MTFNSKNKNYGHITLATAKKIMLLKHGVEIGSANMIKLVAKMGYLGLWEVANGKILVLLFRCWL